MKKKRITRKPANKNNFVAK